MSNILPKKSWHVYNDKNREKVRSDENVARVEKERFEERASSANREHRLSLLRSKAGLVDEEKATQVTSLQRFTLFDPDTGNQDPVKGDFERSLANKTENYRTYRSKKIVNEYSVEIDHLKEDPISNYKKPAPRRPASSNSKHYSFV